MGKYETFSLKKMNLTLIGYTVLPFPPCVIKKLFPVRVALLGQVNFEREGERERESCGPHRRLTLFLRSMARCVCVCLCSIRIHSTGTGCIWWGQCV